MLNRAFTIASWRGAHRGPQACSYRRVWGGAVRHGGPPLRLECHGKGAACPGFVPTHRHYVRTPHWMIPALTYRLLTSAVSYGGQRDGPHTASWSCRGRDSTGSAGPMWRPTLRTDTLHVAL